MSAIEQIEVEDFYSYSYTPMARYGEGAPPHPEIECELAKNLSKYEDFIKSCTDFYPDLLRVPMHPDHQRPGWPHWINGFLPGLDAVVLYCMISKYKPKRYCEIGSGNSTRFAHLAREANSPSTRIISIDPAPRADVATLCDDIQRVPLQSCDQAIFMALEPGDIVFFDGSHRVLQNSDVSVFSLEILPRLKPGVLIQIHDITLPLDYPSVWARRMYSEQYMLATLILFAKEKMEIMFPCAYAGAQPMIQEHLAGLWNAPHMKGIETHGGSFWFMMKSNGQ